MQSPLKESQAIWAQDLMKDEAINITDRINYMGNSLTITGKLLEELCNTTEDIVDVPGIIDVII